MLNSLSCCNCYADGTCELLISTETESRCYLDAFHAARGSGIDAPPHVRCPITIAVGNGRQDMVKFLATEGIKQASRFPKGRLER